MALSYLRETNHLSIHWVQYYYSCMKELLVTSTYGLELILHVRLSNWTFAFKVLCISLVWESSFLPPIYGEKQGRTVSVMPCYLGTPVCPAAQTDYLYSLCLFKFWFLGKKIQIQGRAWLTTELCFYGKQELKWFKPNYLGQYGDIASNLRKMRKEN